MYVSVERELLVQLKKGLIKAIEDELGLDEGVKLIEALNLALGLDKYDSTVIKPSASAVEGATQCL